MTKKVCTACSRAIYKIVPLTNFNKYLHSDTSETEVNINISVNNGSEKLYKKHCDFRSANYRGLRIVLSFLCFMFMSDKSAEV
jgi:hypothetical protein